MKIASQYKTPLLISLALTIVLVAIKAESKPLVIMLIVLGSLLGTFLLDLDYFIYAYFLEPKSDFSKTLTGFIKHGDFAHAFSHIYYHKDDIKDKTLNSALFQVVFTVFMYFTIATGSTPFVKALVLSTFINAMYRFSEYYFNNKTDEWFWILKQPPTKQVAKIYVGVLCVAFVYCLSIF